MPQCKVPLDWQKPNINICLLEDDGHWEHQTYGLGWAIIRYCSPDSPKTRQYTERI